MVDFDFICFSNLGVEAMLFVNVAKESNKIVHSNDSADVIDSTTYQIQAEIKVDILSNGSTKISPSEIKLNGITLVLMPTIDTGAKGRLF